MEKQSRNKWISIIILIFSFGAAVLAVVLIKRNRPLVEGFISRVGLFGPLIMILLYAGLAFSPVPADPLTVINGAVYGPLKGALIAWLGMLAAVIVEYYVGKRIGEAAEFEGNRSQLPLGLGNLPVDSIPFLLGGRLLTGAGSKIVSYLSGIYRISFWRYIWTSAVSTLIGSLIFALIGTGLLNIS